MAVNYEKEKKALRNKVNQLDKEIKEFNDDIREHQFAVKGLTATRRGLQAEQWKLKREIEGIEVAEFYHKQLEKHGLEDTPKVQKLWSRAWEDGHSAGLHEVASYFDDLIDLVQS